MKEINFSREWRRTGERSLSLSLSSLDTRAAIARARCFIPAGTNSRGGRERTLRSPDGDQTGNKETDITRISSREIRACVPRVARDCLQLANVVFPATAPRGYRNGDPILVRTSSSPGRRAESPARLRRTRLLRSFQSHFSLSLPFFVLHRHAERTGSSN